MRREATIGQLVRQFLRQESLETPLAEYRACQAWADVVGAGVERYTRSVTMNGGVMRVELRSPALRANLMLGREGLKQRINQAVGTDVVTQIVMV